MKNRSLETLETHHFQCLMKTLNHSRMHVQQAAAGFQQMRLMVPSDILCVHVVFALEAQKCVLRYLSNVLSPAVLCDMEVRGSLGVREQKTLI